MAFERTIQRIAHMRQVAERIDLALKSKESKLVEIAVSMGKRRFQQGEESPGVKWAPLSKTTELRTKGRRRVGDTPLRDTGRLMGSQAAYVFGNKLILGSNQSGKIPLALHFGREAKPKADSVPAYTVKSHTRKSKKGNAYKVESYKVKAHMRDRTAIPARGIRWDQDSKDRVVQVIFDYLTGAA